MKPKKQTKTNSQIHSLIYLAIKKDEETKSRSKKLKSLLGYSIDDLKRHLEKQFKSGMSWENYGEWHIDHITPKSVFKKTNEAIKKCWSLRNLQPLWANENMRKEGERRASYWTDSIIEKWNNGKTVKEITKKIPLSDITIRYIIKEQIGNEAYQKRVRINIKRGIEKARQLKEQYTYNKS